MEQPLPKVRSICRNVVFSPRTHVVVVVVAVLSFLAKAVIPMSRLDSAAGIVEILKPAVQSAVDLSAFVGFGALVATVCACLCRRDHQTYSFLDSSFLQGQTMAIGRLEGDGLLYRRYRIPGTTNGDSPRSWASVIRPAEVSEQYGQLYCTASGLLVGVRRKGQPDRPGYPREHRLCQALDHPNPEVRRVARQLLEEIRANTARLLRRFGHASDVVQAPRPTSVEITLWGNVNWGMRNEQDSRPSLADVRRCDGMWHEERGDCENGAA